MPLHFDPGSFFYGGQNTISHRFPCSPRWPRPQLPGVPGPIPGPVTRLVPGPVPGSHLPPGPRYRGPSSTCSASSACSGLAWSQASSRCSSSSLRLRDCSLSRSRAGSLSRMPASSSSDVSSALESRLPLESVPASYSTQTLYCGRSPLAAPSHAGSHTRSRSPVSKGRHSRSRSRSRLYRSPAASVGF